MLTKIKRFRYVIWIVLIISVSLFVFNIFFGNKLILKKLIGHLEKEIEAQTSLEIIDVESQYGKLNGNGNGVQYFGVVLVHADNEEDVKKFVKKKANDYEVLEYTVQSEAIVNNKYVQNIQIEYDEKNINWLDGGYYSIYFYESDGKGNVFAFSGH